MRLGALFDKPPSCIRAVLLPRGGILPVALGLCFSAGSESLLHSVLKCSMKTIVLA
jgi:hypothetical protein